MKKFFLTVIAIVVIGAPTLAGEIHHPAVPPPPPPSGISSTEETEDSLSTFDYVLWLFGALV